MCFMTVLGCFVSSARAQSFSPYSDFEAMSLADLQTLQILLTPIGPQDESVPSIAFTAVGNTVDLSKFVPFERPDFSYTDNPTTFQATTQELKSIITNVGTLASVRAGGVAAVPRLSFLMVNLGKGFEAVLNATDAADLFGQLRKSLVSNKTGLLILQAQSCPLSFLDPGNPADVSSTVSVALTGFRLNRQTNRFVTSATMKNTSSSDIPGPVSVVFFTSAGVSLANPDGTTCKTTPVGATFLNLPGTGLAPSQAVQVSLEFLNPNFQVIRLTTKVLAGPGAR